MDFFLPTHSLFTFKVLSLLFLQLLEKYYQVVIPQKQRHKAEGINKSMHIKKHTGQFAAQCQINAHLPPLEVSEANRWELFVITG